MQTHTSHFDDLYGLLFAFGRGATSWMRKGGYFMDEEGGRKGSPTLPR